MGRVTAVAGRINGETVHHFRTDCHTTLNILASVIERQEPVFVMPSWFVSPDNAHVGLLLSELVRELAGEPPGTAYRSFFANSRFEAMHGAIKLMRHSRLGTFGEHGGRIIVVEQDGILQRRTDPLGSGEAHALVPGLAFAATAARARQAMQTPFAGMLIRTPDRLRLADVTALAAECRRQGAALALDLADLDPVRRDQPVVAAARPDLVVLGESMTGHEVPFGAFVGSHAIFSCWSDPATAFLHSNTYGGNTVAMRRVQATLAGRWEHQAPDRDWRRVLELYGRHVNPVTAAMHRRLCGALHVVKAAGSYLTVRLDSGRELEVVDGLCGAGLGLAGHNPPDALTDVVSAHDPGEDYVARLEGVLAQETGLPNLFPAVSGASAVETALTLAVLARPERRRIVVFKHNYAGKTLVSLIGTAAERTRSPFGPLYDDVRYIDPFAPDATKRLRAELAGGQVGLVWIELVHGSSDSYAPIPDDLLQIVTELRAEHGYLIGVDEILTSYFRCGTRFAHHDRLPDIDLMTLSKALSYGCFPIGAALVSDEVADAARSANPGLVEELRTCHANRLGAHFGLHAVAQADGLGLGERVPVLSRIVQDGLGAMGHRRSVGRRFAEGLLGQIEVLVPRPLRRFLDQEQTAMLWWITQARVFIIYDVFLLPVNAAEKDIRQVMRQAVRLSRTGRWTLLAQLALFMARERLAGRRRA